jgi:hypothetical protein
MMNFGSMPSQQGAMPIARNPLDPSSPTNGMRRVLFNAPAAPVAPHMPGFNVGRPFSRIGQPQLPSIA